MNAYNSSENIIDKLNSPKPKERSRVLSCIGFERVEGYLEKIITMMLQDPVDEVRERAAYALDCLNDLKALPAFIKAIHDPSWAVRTSAGWGLIHLGKIVEDDVRDVFENSANPNAVEIAKLVLERL